MPESRGNRGGGHEAIYRVVRRIPRGRVATYGQVARLAGIPRQARRVGYALSALQGREEVPWHRVVNARGRVSPRSSGEPDDRQRRLLEAEGVVFNEHGSLSLEAYQWREDPGTDPWSPLI